MRSVVPNPGHILVAIELAVTQAEETQIKATELIVLDASGKQFEPVGSAAFSWDSNFEAFRGVSGWRTVSANGSSIKIGRASTADPMSFVLSGVNAKLFLLYIVPDSQQSLTLMIGTGKPTPLAFQR